MQTEMSPVHAFLQFYIRMKTGPNMQLLCNENFSGNFMDSKL